MIIKFHKVPVRPTHWFAEERDIAFFHHSLRERIVEELSKIDGMGAIHYGDTASIVFSFETPADEDFFILKYINGLEIN